jgi:hypothetical protein
MDIETINVDNKLTPYLICGYNGSEYISSFGKDQNALFGSFIDQLLSLMVSKTLIVYAHNLSGFDGVFLMKHLISYGEVTPLIHDGKLMSITLKTTSGKIIKFKDSYLLLPLSLRQLCVAFGVSIPKGYFPFNLNDIFYTGVLPKFEYWTGLSLSTYEGLSLEHKNKFWSFKLEAIKYCELDCKCLYELLVKFSELIFTNFEVDIHKVLTLPSLAMKIYKIHYMPKDSIYQLLGNVGAAIRESYTGGAVDVYIPHNRIGDFSLPVKGMFKKTILLRCK